MISNFEINSSPFGEFQSQPRWVCFEAETKKPINPRTGGNAMNSQPGTWGTYWDCIEFMQHPYSSENSAYNGAERAVGGIGIEFGMPPRTDKDGNPLPATPNRIAGIDLDDVRDPDTGEITDEAKSIIEAFQTYTEISPSGTGVHMLIKVDDAAWTLAGKKLLLDDASLSDTGKAEIEFYTDARYFTVTGNVLDGYALPISTGKQAVFESYRDTYIKREDERRESEKKKREKKRVHEREEAPSSTGGIGVQRPKRKKRGLPVPEGGARSVKEAVEILSSWDESYRALFEDGDIEPLLAEKGKGDFSKAELVFLRALFTVCQKRALVEEVFTTSPLFTAEREAKWNEIHFQNGETYGHHTLDLAEAGWREAEKKEKKEKRVHDKEYSEGEQLAAADEADAAYRLQITQGLRFSLPAYRAHVESGVEKRVPTGIPGLDELLGGGIYPGLVMLGGRTGTGKTTLALQIITGMVAAEGYPVLYVALEMDRHEIAAKCIASIYNQALDMKPERFVSFGSLLENRFPGVSSYSVDEAEQAFANGLGAHLYILDVTDERVTTEAVERAAQDIAESEGRPPLVVIDYLQLLWPEQERLSDIERANINSYMLKRLNKKHHMPVIVLSSFNRASYSLPKTKEGELKEREDEEWYEVLESAFRDSGGIEFTADMLLALRIPFRGNSTNYCKQEKIYVLKNRRHSRHIVTEGWFYGAGGFFHVPAEKTEDDWDQHEKDEKAMPQFER